MGRGEGTWEGRWVERKSVEVKIKKGERCTHAQVHFNGGLRVVDCTQGGSTIVMSHQRSITTQCHILAISKKQCLL